MTIGGAGVSLDPSALSAIRFRAAYGESVVTALGRCRSAQETEGQLLRMCHMMIPVADRPELLEFAALARRDGSFFMKALTARDALLAGDPRQVRTHTERGAEPFDEYKVLALMAAARVDMSLIYELPILHLLSVVHETFALRDTEGKQYHPMTKDEMARLYPRRG